MTALTTGLSAQQHIARSYRALRICAWCGPAFLVTLGLGFFVIAGFIPPISPHDSAQAVAYRFRHDTTSIRVGLLIALFGSALLCPWYSITGMLLRRVAGRNSPWATTYLMAATVTVVAFLIPYMTWFTAAFRPEQTSPELLQRLDDLGWIPWIGMASTAVVQGVMIAIAVFSDRRDTPLLPRWVGYLSLFSATSLIPPTFLVFFKTGPLAWNGLFFYISLAFYTGWIIALTFAMIRAINRLEREEPIGPDLDTAPANGQQSDIADELANLRRQVERLEAHQQTHAG